MEPKMMFKPTKEQYQALQGAFDYFNQKLFKDSLPQVMLTLNRERNTFGYYCPNVWTKAQDDDCEWGEIALNPDYIFREGRTERDVYSTLIHEMCHLWQEYDGSAPRRCYHNKDFSEKMERVGLITSDTGEEGGKRTGQKMTHYIQEGGPFAKAYEEMPDSLSIPCRTLFAMQGTGGKKKIKKARSSTVTYFCPKCGATVKGKEGTHVICGDCMEPMLIKTGRDK